MSLTTLRRRIAGAGRVGWKKGFTLVELMIAMALVGLLTALIYGMFVRTSEALQEVEGLSEALDQGRFGLDYLRTDLKMAGAQATPNSDPLVDRSVTMLSNERYMVQGVMGYDGWQDQAHGDLGGEAELDDSNPGSRFSGIVVTGAYDTPGVFFSQFRRLGGAGSQIDEGRLIVEADGQGLARLRGFDPFDRTITVAPGDLPDPDDIDLLGRMLRVIDTDGQKQFSPIGSTSSAGNDLEIGGLDLIFEDDDNSVIGLQEGLRGVGPGDEPGFSASIEDDVDLDTAIIDAYWYHVQPAPGDGRTMQLVRQRVNASNITAQAMATGLSEGDLRGEVLGPTMVIAENIVDLRIWFDCVDANGNWDTGNRIDGSEWDVINDDNNCVTSNPANSNPERAKYANIRLSTRTDRENSNRPHLDIADQPGFEEDGGRMQTYELVDTAEGSASVVTLETGVEMTNFSLMGGN